MTDAADDERSEFARDRGADTMAEGNGAGRTLRTPKSAAVAGIVFSVIFAVALVLVRTAVPADPNDAGRWLSDSSRRDAVLFALGLIPFAGIAFLWFVAVLRDRVGEAEDKFFATVFLGTALVFVGRLFVASAVAAGLVASVGSNGDSLLSSSAWEVGRHPHAQFLRQAWGQLARSGSSRSPRARTDRNHRFTWVILSPETLTRRPWCESEGVEPCVYRIVVEGELGSRYEAAFIAMRLEARNGRTEIVGPIDDQAELQGVLDEVAALGLSLVSVAPVGE